MNTANANAVSIQTTINAQKRYVLARSANVQRTEADSDFMNGTGWL